MSLNTESLIRLEPIRGVTANASELCGTVPVLIVGNFLSAAMGTYGVCEDLAARLSKHHWHVITTSNRLNKLTRLVDMVATVFRERHRFAVAQVDVYSDAAFRWAEAVCHTLRGVRKPYILTLHGGNLPIFASREAKRVRRLLRSAAAVTTPSRYLFETMVDYRHDLHLLPNPLETGAYEFRLRTKPTLKLIWLRAFHEIYNPALAPKVVAHLAREFPDVQLTMIGPDKQDGSLRRMREVAATLNVSGRITVPGSIRKDEVSKWMNSGDIFLNTSSIDNTPVSVLEAMACGLCVVSTDVGGIKYLLHHETDALVVPADNAEAMATAVQRIVSEPAVAAHLSRNARRQAEQFDWSVVLPQWQSLFRRVAIDARV